MRKISDTIARLGALRAQHSAHANDHREHGRLRTLTDFGSDPGALNARYHLPPALPLQAPLVVVLHGCTQNASGYDHHSGWSRLADEAGFAVLFPEQQRANNANLCFNWFQPGDIKRDSGEACSIRQMIEAMVLAHDLDRSRIFITGLSAGGAMAAAMLAVYPEVFAGGAIVAGLPYGVASSVPEAFDRMRGHGVPSGRELQRSLRGASSHRGPWPRISIWQGTADHTVAPSNAQAMAAQWQDVHAVDSAPSQARSTGVRSVQSWHDSAGRAAIEINMISGMGHGTPIGDGLGAPGPYMLDVGVSSTREIARFWDIDAAQQVESQPSRSIAPSHQGPAARPLTPTADGPGPNSPRPMQSHPAKQQSGGVTEIIENALRAAGLMR